MPVRMFGAGDKGRTARLGWLVQRGDGLKGLRNAERGVNAKFGEAAKSVCVVVVWCMKTVICNSFCSMSVCLCINGITSCRVCVFVGRLCVLIHQCARSD